MHNSTENSEFQTHILKQKKKESDVHIIANVREKYDAVRVATLEDALEIFKLPSLQDLDNALDMARKNKENRKEYEEHINEKVDKRLKELYLEYHPDKIQEAEASNEDIAKATELFKVIKSVVVTIEKLHKSIFEDVNFKYSFYSKMEVSLLHNTQKLEQVNLKISSELCSLSDIEQDELVPIINQFLRFSQSSMEKFIAGDKSGDFIRERNKALTYSSSYVDSYKNLIEEMRSVKRKCKTDKDLSYIEPFIDEMLGENEAQLGVLEKVKKLSKDLVKGKLQFSVVGNDGNIDKYLVLPLVRYVNVLSMCSKVYAKEKELSQKSGNFAYDTYNKVSGWLGRKSKNNGDSDINEKDLQVTDLYDASFSLMSWYCDGKAQYEAQVRDILGKTGEISCERVRNKFISVIKEYKNYLAKEFKPEDYIGASRLKELMSRCEKLKVVVQEVRDALNEIRDDFNVMKTELKEMKVDYEETITRVQERVVQTDIQLENARASAARTETLLQRIEQGTIEQPDMKKVNANSETEEREEIAQQIEEARANAARTEVFLQKMEQGTIEQSNLKKVNANLEAEEQRKITQQLEELRASASRLEALLQKVEQDKSAMQNAKKVEAGPSCKLDEVQPTSHDRPLHSGCS